MVGDSTTASTHPRGFKPPGGRSRTMTERRWYGTLSRGRRGCWPLWNIILRERTDTVGDKGGKKDKSKSDRQKKSKQDKQAKKKLDKQQAQKNHGS